MHNAVTTGLLAGSFGWGWPLSSMKTSIRFSLMNSEDNHNEQGNVSERGQRRCPSHPYSEFRMLTYLLSPGNRVATLPMPAGGQGPVR